MATGNNNERPGVGSRHFWHRRMLCFGSTGAAWHDQRWQLQLQDPVRRRELHIQSRTLGSAMQKHVRESLFGLHARGNKIKPKARSCAGVATARCSPSNCSLSSCSFRKSRPPHQLRSIWLPASNYFGASSCRTKLSARSAGNPSCRQQWNQQDRVRSPAIL
jgi:hypothetical protein